jgi:cell division protein FtsQ
MKKAWKIGIGLVLLAYLLFALIFAESSRKGVICKGISITIADENKYRFVKEKEILRLIENTDNDLIGKKLTDINCNAIVEKAYKHPAVAHADVYTTIDGKLHVRITQRRPVVRVVNAADYSYYIDSDGKIMPLSDNFSAQVLVANGNIYEPMPVSKIKTLTQEADTFKDASRRVVFELYQLALFISNDDFWKNQIQQVYVNEHNELELIPTVGDQTILLGNTDDLEYKLKKLRSMYYVFNEIGWNKYAQINLKYKNQIICTKRDTP